MHYDYVLCTRLEIKSCSVLYNSCRPLARCVYISCTNADDSGLVYRTMTGRPAIAAILIISIRRFTSNNILVVTFIPLISTKH